MRSFQWQYSGHFVAMNFSKYFKFTREEPILRKVTKLFYVFGRTPDEVEKHVQWNFSDTCTFCCNVEILNIFNTELHVINAKTKTKNKLK